MTDKFATRNAVLEWAVSEQLHHTFIHEFSHKFSKLASCENCEILEKDVRLQVRETKASVIVEKRLVIKLTKNSNINFSKVAYCLIEFIYVIRFTMRPLPPIPKIGIIKLNLI
jgi:hypothetical protein